jgi:hypothetical protein
MQKRAFVIGAGVFLVAVVVVVSLVYAYVYTVPVTDDAPAPAGGGLGAGGDPARNPAGDPTRNPTGDTSAAPGGIGKPYPTTPATETPATAPVDGCKAYHGVVLCEGQNYNISNPAYTVGAGHGITPAYLMTRNKTSNHYNLGQHVVNGFNNGDALADGMGNWQIEHTTNGIRIHAAGDYNGTIAFPLEKKEQNWGSVQLEVSTKVPASKEDEWYPLAGDTAGELRLARKSSLEKIVIADCDNHLAILWDPITYRCEHGGATPNFYDSWKFEKARAWKKDDNPLFPPTSSICVIS